MHPSFRQPTEAGLADFIEGDGEWRAGDGNLALGQSQRDLAHRRLFIGVVTVGDRFKRMGVATRLVEAAEDWGRANGAVTAVCDTYIGSPVSMPFWEARMGYTRTAVIVRKPLV